MTETGTDETKTETVTGTNDAMMIGTETCHMTVIGVETAREIVIEIDDATRTRTEIAIATIIEIETMTAIDERRTKNTIATAATRTRERRKK
jgi:hypothetical protein